MNSGWHWFVIALTAVNILACWWLMRWSSAQGDESKDDNATLDHTWDENLQERNQPLPRWWLMLFNITIVFSIGYLVLFPGLGNFAGALGWSMASQYETERDEIDAVYSQMFTRLAAMDFDDLKGDEEAIRVGANLYAGNCATCHGSDGGGAVGFPSLKDNAWLYGNDEQTLITSISQGRIGAMAPMGTALEAMGVQVDDMVEKVRSLSGLEHDAAAATRAQAGWALCMACHGPEGKGNPALGAPNLTDDAWLYGADAAAISTSITQGRNGQMPAHSELLSEEQIKVLAAYVSSLSQG